MTTAPDIGDVFTETDDDWPIPRTYVVKGWLKRAERGERHGPDRCPLMFCTREEAEYIAGNGVCGVIRRAGEVSVTGRVGWSDERIQHQRDLHAVLVGRPLY
jgi:hypothetical protein